MYTRVGQNMPSVRFHTILSGMEIYVARDFVFLEQLNMGHSSVPNRQAGCYRGLYGLHGAAAANSIIFDSLFDGWIYRVGIAAAAALFGWIDFNCGKQRELSHGRRYGRKKNRREVKHYSECSERY